MPRIFEVSAADLPRLFRQVEEKRPLAVIRGVISAAFAGAEVVARAEPKDLGTLKQSTRAEIVGDGKSAVIVVDAPHAGIVEMGARPHWAPIGPLIEWAKRHGDPDDAVRFAYAIRAKIAREGQKPTYFMRKSLPKLRKILKLEVEREMAIGEG